MYGKEKTCESRFYWNLKLFTKVFTVGQMLSHTLDGLNFCATLLKMNALLQKISENFRNGKIFWRQNFFVGINYSLVNIFVTWQKIESLFTDKVFTDKGQSSRLLSHENHGEDKCFSLSCKTLPIAKKLHAGIMQNLKNKARGLRRIIYIGHPQKNWRHSFESFSDAYLGSSWTLTLKLFCKTS